MGAIKQGNVSAKSENDDATSLGDPTMEVLFQPQPTPQPAPTPSDGFTNQYKVVTQLTSNSPEIIAFLDFIPIYNKNGDLNKIGQFFQAKQDSKLISANASITSILNSSILDDLTLNASNTKSELNEFCTSFAGKFESLMSTILRIKSNLDFRIVPELQWDLKIGGASLATLQEINYLHGSAGYDQVNGWTSTKAWIQSCLELKEALKNGQLDKMLTPAFLGGNPNNNNDPYKLYVTPSQTVLKFNFNSTEGFELQLSQEPHIRLARYASILCKEFIFSTQMNKNTQLGDLLLSEYGYTQKVDGTNNFEVWDYLFGKAGGVDITDIPYKTLDEGKSLISLSQSITNDSAEVLSFENYYIKDNVGTQRPHSVITPGMIYYVESFLSDPGGEVGRFKINEYILKLKRSSKMLNLLRQTLTFDTTVIKHTSLEYWSGESEEYWTTGGEGEHRKYNFSKDLSNPIFLLKSIEESILDDTDLTPNPLIVAAAGPRSLSNHGIATQNLTPGMDFSAVLISLALQTPDLMTALFLNCIDKNQTTAVNITKTLQAPSAKKHYAGYESMQFSDFKSATRRAITFSDIEDALYQTQPTPGGYILHKIAQYINALSDYLDSDSIVLNDIFKTNSKMFVDSEAKKVVVMNNVPVNTKVTIYSGIEKEAYLLTVFKLCCLIVHYASGFEKITGLGSNYIIVDISGEGIAATSERLTNKIISDSQFLLYNYNLNLFNKINRFYAFVSVLEGSLRSLFDSLNILGDSDVATDDFLVGSFLKPLRDIIDNPVIANRLLLEEQINLIRSKLFDFQQRTSNSYSSPIKQLIPYFLSLKNNEINDFLPIEDVHLVSWNLFLKNFLKNDSYREENGFNKKIISIGIPNGLYKRTLSLINASDLNKKIKNKLIKINLYRINELNSNIYEPKSYLFDLNRYQTRVLQNFIDSGFSITGNQDINLTIYNDGMPYIPILKTQSGTNNNAYELHKDQSISFDDSPFLTIEQKTELIKNHSISFLMEEYIRYISNTSFDEHRYHKYDNLSSKERNDMITNHFSNNQSMQSFIAEESFLTDVKSLKKSLITPKKFDRVFHIIFDPDDFIVTNDDNNQPPSATPDKITFDKYYATIETHE